MPPAPSAAAATEPSRFRRCIVWALMPPIVREMKLSNIAFAKRLRAMLLAAGIFAFTPLMSLFRTRFIALCVLWRALNVSMLRRCFMMMLNHYDDDGDGHDRHMAACITRLNVQIREAVESEITYD